jgi:hypothetical protein
MANVSKMELKVGDVVRVTYKTPTGIPATLTDDHDRSYTVEVGEDGLLIQNFTEGLADFTISLPLDDSDLAPSR